MAIVYLAYSEWVGVGALQHGDPTTWLLLAVSGPLTALPLWLFAYGARRTALSTVGLLQYIGPTISLAIGVGLFDESFPLERAIGFACIWVGLALYAADGFISRGRAMQV